MWWTIIYSRSPTNAVTIPVFFTEVQLSQNDAFDGRSGWRALARPSRTRSTRSWECRSGQPSHQIRSIRASRFPEAVVNFVALLGWSPENNQEIFSLDELVKEFNYKNDTCNPAVFDMVKLK